MNPTNFAANFVEKTNFHTCTSGSVQDLSDQRYLAIAAALEEGNHHSEFVVFAALRAGSPSQIGKARAILADHEAAGFLTDECYSRRSALLSEIFSTPTQPAATITRLHRESTASEYVAEAYRNAAMLDVLEEPFPDVAACLAAGQSPETLARTTREAVADVLSTEPIGCN